MVSNKNFLDFVPVCNEWVSFDSNEKGELLLVVQNKGFYNRIAQMFFHRSKVSEIELDEMGSFVLPLIDGRRSIYDIGKSVKEHFGEAAEPLYPRLVKYMKILQSYKYISFDKSQKK